ncbi:MAG: GH32 C-terminal domain-containing protein [Candidatus Izemoplasmatales bacterium]|nr:GH32 C-terminal domain-containing protein [Candidatus Izemoplasmatales bacterium]
MTKKIVLGVIVMVSAFLMACQSNTNMTTQPTSPINTDPIDPLDAYRDFYAIDRDSAYVVNSPTATHKASHGYQGMAEQGYNGWSYGEVTDAEGYRLLDWNNDIEIWGTESHGISGSRQWSEMHPVMKTFTVLSGGSGTVMISGNPRPLEQTARFQIKLNDQVVYPLDGGSVTLDDSTPNGSYISFPLSVQSGDQIHFVTLDGDMEINPTIAYDTQETSLYFDFTGTFGNGYPRHIGDVHPFYHDGKMYMFYLETNGRYTSALIESDNMILYRERDIQTRSPHPTIDTYYVLGIARYQDRFISYYGASVSNIYASVSDDLYTWSAFNQGVIPITGNTSGRDPFVFYDPDIDRYRIVFTSYYSRDTSPSGDFDAALWLATSQSNSPVDWQQENVELIRYDNQGASGREDPEVSQFVKIGNRWYLIASIYSRSVHGVGRLSYWKGEIDTFIDDDHWQEKQEQYIDGEDLCAAQLVQVGDKWYMFGWIPNNANSSQWGGALNIAREVYQLENGDLATRLDPYLSQLLNKGNLYSLNTGDVTELYGSHVIDSGRMTLQASEQGRYGFDSYGEVMLDGEYTRFIIDATLSISDPNGKTGFVLKNQTSASRHFVYIDRAQDMLIVYSRTPEGNEVRSSIHLELDSYEDIEINVLVDGSIVDVFVNDRFSLAARVMTKGFQELINASVSVFSSRDADILSLTLSKLASQEDIFD